jgi:lysine 6-dehydrogenase
LKKIIILGAGMVGKTMAIDLVKKYDVTSADIDENALSFLSGKYNIKTQILNVKDKDKLASVISDFDLVISAVPGFLGFETMKSIILNKKDLIDISFMPEDVLVLDPLAKENNVTVIMDCGVAPGMPNYIAGYYNELMEIEKLEYMVGGLPKVRTFPFEYKAPFSPIDVIEEYTRPARYVENGHMIVKPALSDTELLEFEKAGTLESFNSDGLRSLIYTLKNIPHMKEKTLRFPGHVHLVKALMASGFFDKNPVNVKGVEIIPIDFTSRILFNVWKLGNEEPEFTIMRIIIEGKENGKKKKITYDLFDEYDEKEKLSSMSRTTGFTATASAGLLIEKLFTKKGVFPPELVGKDAACFNFVLNYLKERNVIYQKNVIEYE